MGGTPAAAVARIVGAILLFAVFALLACINARGSL
jgi:hypothetical protein